MRSGAIQWQAESEHSMLNTSVTHITELEDAIKAAIHCLEDSPLQFRATQLQNAAESFGLDLSENE